MKAFPLNSINEKNFCTNQGMDLRDYFAAKAMQIFIGEEICLNNGEIKWATSICYQIADGMMEARKND